MDEELKQKLMEYLLRIEDGAKRGADFVIEQAPLYVQELLAWEFWSHALTAVALLLATGCIYWLAVKSANAMRWADSGEARSAYWLPLLVGVIIGGITAGFAVGAIMGCVKVEVAPRVVIVDKLREALK